MLAIAAGAAVVANRKKKVVAPVEMSTQTSVSTDKEVQTPLPPPPPPPIELRAQLHSMLDGVRGPAIPIARIAGGSSSGGGSWGHEAIAEADVECIEVTPLLPEGDQHDGSSLPAGHAFRVRWPGGDALVALGDSVQIRADSRGSEHVIDIDIEIVVSERPEDVPQCRGCCRLRVRRQALPAIELRAQIHSVVGGVRGPEMPLARIGGGAGSSSGGGWGHEAIAEADVECIAVTPLLPEGDLHDGGSLPAGHAFRVQWPGGDALVALGDSVQIHADSRGGEHVIQLDIEIVVSGRPGDVPQRRGRGRFCVRRRTVEDIEVRGYDQQWSLLSCLPSVKQGGASRFVLQNDAANRWISFTGHF